MNEKVQKALEARKQREERYAPSLTPSSDKVRSALEKRQKRMDSTAEEDVKRIYRRYENAIKSYNRNASNNEEAYGKDATKSIDNFRGDSVSLSELLSDVEAYRKYIGDEDADTMLKSLSKLKDGYGAMYSNAATFSQFDSKDEYDSAVRMVGYSGKYSGMSYEDQKEAADRLRSDYESSYDPNISESKAFELSKAKEELDWLYANGDSRIQAEGRKMRYAENEKRIAELDSKIESLKASGVKTHDARGTMSTQTREEQREAIRKLEAERDDLVSENTMYRRTQGVMDEYQGYTSSADFEAVSNQRDFENPSKEDLITYPTRNAYAGYTLEPLIIEDRLGMYLSTAEEAHKEAFGYQMGENQWADVIREGDANSWNKLTEGEVDIYYYILNTQGAKAADKYLTDMTTELNRRRHEEDKEIIDKSSGLEKVFLNVVSVPMNVFGGATGFVEDVGNTLMGKDINPYSLAHGGTLFASTVRESTAESIAKATEGFNAPLTDKNIPEFLYQTGMSMADSALGAATMGSGYSLMMGMGSATTEARRLYESGATKSQIAMGGLFAGAAETVFEKLSLDNLLKQKDIRSAGQLVKEIFKQGGVEASEEVFTEIANRLSNQMVMGSNSDYSKAVEAYMAEGKSRAEAESLAFMDSVGDVIWAGVGGFISGAGMGGAFDTVQYYNNVVAEGKNVIESYGVDSLKALALEMAEGGQGKNLTKLAGKVDGDASAKNVGKLSFAVDNSRVSQNRSEIAKSLMNEGMSAREAKKTAQTIVEVADKKASGADLTQKEYDAVTKDRATYEAYSSLISDPDSSVNSRNAKYGLARRGYEMSEDGYVRASDSLMSHVADKAVHEVALSNISSQNRFSANTGAVEDASDDVVPMTEEEATLYKGKTTVYDAESDSHREVKIAGVASIKDGEMMLKLEDGETVNARDVRFASDGEALVYSAVLDMGVNSGVAEALIGNFDQSATSAGKYALGIKDAYSYGKMNIPLSQLSENSFARDLSKSQMEFAYKLGQSEAKAEVKAKQKVIDAKVAKAKGKAQSKSGKVIVEEGIAVDKAGNIDESGLTDVQKASLVGIKALAKLSPLNFHIFASEKVNGEFVATINGERVEGSPNGVYFAGTNDIWIDINAGDMGEGTMLWTASHEISHYIKERSPAKWKAMADFLMKEYAKKQGVSVSEMLDKQKAKIMARADADTKTESEIIDEAYEELVSNALSGMLTDGSIINALADLKQQNKGLWQTIRDAVEALLKRWGEVLGAYKGRTHDEAEARSLAGMEKAYKKLQKMYTEAFAEANAVEEAEAYLKENGIDIVTDGKQEAASLNSVRNLLDDSQKQKVAKALATRLEVTEAEAMEWLKAETALASLILNPKYSQYLDYEADDSEEAIKKNSDYPQGTVDFSNICKKRRAFTEVMGRVLRNFPNHVFMATDLAKIRTIMEQEGMEVACAICYVEDRRQLDSIVGQNFLDSLELYRKGSKTRPDGKPFNTQQLKAMKLIEGDTYTPSIYELVTLEGRNELKAKNPNMEAAWVTFNNARGMQSVRLLTNEAEYERQILKYNKKTVQSKNDLGGLRIYSFSDMEMFHLIDIIQVITDSSAVGLMLQGYTKVNEYAKAVKDTGEKLNRSLIPKGELGYHLEDGKVVLDFDTVEGIDINHPDFFDNIDNPDVGNIVIGINKKQIQAAMVSEFIDQIIPFHTGQSGEVLGEKGIAAWQNYKDFQTEKDLATGNTSSHQINIYTEVIQAAEKEGKPITNKYEFVNKFLKVCKENGLEPRFSEFLNTDENGDYVYTEGYHKFLVDFKTFDQKTGEYLPQKPVKPLFDNKYITGLLENYAKSQKQKDAELAKSMPKVIERITNEVVKPAKKLSERNASTVFSGAVNAIQQELGSESAAVISEMTTDVMNTVKFSSRNNTTTDETYNLIGKEKMVYAEGDAPPDLTLVEVYNERTGKTETTVKFVGNKPKDYVPKKIAYCYKLFEQHPDGSLHALFAGASNATPVGEWQYAQGFPYTDSGVKGMNLRERYGWHLSAGLPSAPHLMSSKEFERGYPSKNAFGHPKGSKRVWVRMAYDASVDFNSLADSTKAGDIFGLIPFGGYYAFKENNQSEWVISSAVKIDKILTEDERQQILRDAGYDEYEAWRKKHRATETEKAESRRKSIENKKAKDKAKKEGLNYLSESAKEMREAIKSRIIDNPEVKYSSREFSEAFVTNTLNTFGIEKYGDYIHVQKQVFETLLAEGFFADVVTRSRTDVNEESGMAIEINKSSISETFNLSNYGRLGKFKKIAKLSTVKLLPEIIKKGKLISDNVPNQYQDSENKSFAYIAYDMVIDGIPITVKLDIKKSPIKNKLWVHSIVTEKNSTGLDVSSENGAGTSYRADANGDIITQPSDYVKRKNSERNNIGYHAGDLGKAEFYHQQGKSRDTGHFGTGTYFVGDEAQISGDSTYGKRPHHAVNFDNYNLYKVRDDNDGYKLHSQLRVIDGGFTKEFLEAAKKGDFEVSNLRSQAYKLADGYSEEVWDDDLMMSIPEDYVGASIRGFTEVAQANSIDIQSYDEWLAEQSDDVPTADDSDYDFYRSDYLDHLREELGKADEKRNNGYEDFRDAYFGLWLRFGTNNVNRALQAVIDHDAVMRPSGEADYNREQKQRADSRATVFMKALGYEGVDVRGTGLDNVGYGSVIYDLKKNTVLYSERNKAPIFYSYMGKVIDGIKSEKVGAGGVVPYLKGKGVKNEEIKWSGIEAFLEGKKSLTKAELQEFVAGSMLQIEEENSANTDSGIKLVPNEDTGELLLYIDGVIDDTFTKNENGEYESQESGTLFSDPQAFLESIKEDYGRVATRWHSYKLDGGTNYREIVFTMPNSSYSNNAMKAHWGEDAEGVIAHARIQDFDTSEGKMLFIEEIQSDWHNEGHKDGYRDDAKLKELQELEEKANEAFYALEDYSTELTGLAGEYEAVAKTQKGRELLRAKIGAEKALKQAQTEYDSKVPDAPFKDTYHEYVMKRLVRMAAEEGYDIIGWTPAEIQVNRWSEEYAEGYRIEYDQDIPKFLNKYGKKWGTKVGTATVNDTEVWSMPITDSMKDSVLYEGQAMYSERNTDSNRSLLANALETTVQNDIEAKKLKEYKAKISLIDAEQRKLADINAEIRELSFSKGKRDAKRLKSLRFDAVQAANRINTYDRQLLNLESTKVLKNVLDREKGLAKKSEKRKYEQSLAEYREKRNAREEAIKEKYRESRQKASMSRAKTAMRHKIKRVVSDLNQLLLRPTKDKHVMIGLQKATAEALSAVNMEKGIGLGKNFADLRVAYEDIKNSDDPLMAGAYEEAIKDRIDNLRSSVGDTSIMDMSLEQLEEVYDTFKIVLTTIRNADKSFKAKKGESISILGNRAMEEILTVGGSKDRSVKALEGIKSFAWNGLKPSYAMDMIGSDTLSEMFDNVRAGEDTWARDVSEAREFYRTTAEKHGYDSWDTEESHSFVVGGGKSVSLSLDQMMSLYAYSKRKQADKHLELGGFVFDDAIEVTEKVKGIPVKYRVKTATAHKLSKDELASIIGKLTPEQRAFVDDMQDYLSTVMGNKGNEVSLEMYGVKLFKEKHYFPLKSAKQFMFEQNEVSGEVKLKNSGFSKETVVNANNPIILSNFMDVWSGHVNDMSMYHSFVLPLEDFNRVFNYRTPTSDNYDTESVKMYLQNAYGNQPAQYIKQMLTDLNGGARMDTTAGIVNKGLALFKKGAVFASASVVVQQPSALVRAMASVNPKYFIGSLNLKNHKKTWEEVKKYAPVAIIKEMGYFDTNMGMQTTEWISQTEYKGFGSKAKGFFVDSDYRDEVLSMAPALADELTWAYIWSAVKREVAATTKFPAGSEAFLKKAGERFTEVIVDTQVYDSVLSRSAMMRSKDTGMKMATAFMAEPTASINMIANALVQGKRGNVAYARNAIGAVVGSMILNSILVSFVYAARDDDEEKTYAEKYIGTLASEVIGSLNPLDLIPFVKDIVSIVQGYDVERSDMAVISDLWSAFENLSSDKKSAYDKVKGFVGAVTQVFGLPIKNIWRDAEAMYNVVSSATSGQKTTGAGIWTAVRETVTGKDISNADELMEAMVKGDEAHAERVKARFENEDKTNSALKAAIKKKYKDGKLDATETEQYLKDFLGMTEEEIHWQMDEWEYAIENGSSEGYAKYGDFYTAVETGKDLKAVIKEYTDNGVEEKTLASRITAYYKPKYKEMSNVERAKLKGYLLNAYVLLGYNKSKKSKDIDEWLED